LVIADDLWIYVYEKGEARYTDLIKAFVDTKKCSKTVLLKYKIQLEATGKIAKKISSVTNRPVYYVPEKFQKEVEKLLGEHEVTSLINSFDAKWFGLIKRMLLSILSKMQKGGVNPEWLMETQALLFIPIMRSPTPTSPVTRIFYNLVFFPPEEKAMEEVMKFLKEEQWIH